MRFITFLPKTKKAVIRLLMRWAVILCLLIGVIFFITTMPGTSYSGPFHQLNSDELALRDS